jgi:cysteine desulfurase
MSEIYFDYAATTPVDEQVIQDMLAHMGRHENFGNPASASHAYGQRARLAVERARRQVAGLVGARADHIVWTSGATESNNLALKGVAATAQHRGHIITSRLEHKAVLDTVAHLQQQGATVTWLEPDDSGLIQPQAVAAALRDDTRLVSLMLVNNEIGTLSDIAAIGALVRQHGALFHVDAAQATGKVAIDLSVLPVDLMSFSAHKTYGPKGIGALYVGERAAPLLQAQIHGGGHERGMRSGTLATHQIVGMGSAFALAGDNMQAEGQRIAQLSAQLLEGLLGFPGVRLNGSASQRIPHTLNVCFDHAGFDVERLEGIMAFSSTSACNSACSTPSHVLLAIGLDATQAYRSIRLSLGRYTTREDVERALAAIQACLTR